MAKAPKKKPSIDGKALTERFKSAHAERQKFLSMWEDCYTYAIPGRASFFGGEDPVSSDLIFDETAVVGVQELASRLQSSIIPPFGKFFQLVAGAEVPAGQRAKVDDELQKITDYVHEVLANSNLAQEVHEGFMELTIGTAGLLVEEDRENLVRFSAAPLGHLVLDQGPDDRVDGVFRSRKRKLADIKRIWPNAVIPPDVEQDAKTDEKRTFETVECVYRDWNRRDTDAYVFAVLLPDKQHVLVSDSFEGSGSKPWIAFRWGKMAGEVYGRGPLLNAMPAVKTCNMVVELILENAQLNIAGMWQADDDGVLNPDTVQLVPGTIIPKAANSQGLQPLTPGGNFDVAQLVLEEMRHNIKKALYNEQLGRPDKTPMTALEVSERMADLARQIGSAFGRLHTELVTPLIQRVLYLLVKQGRIQVPTVNGRQIKIVNKSPLAQAQNHDNVARFMRFMEIVNGGFGSQMAMMKVKGEAGIDYIGQQLNIPQSLLRTADEVKQAQQDAGAAAGMAMAGGIDPTKAVEAMTGGGGQPGALGGAG
jgi:hypothetical protein